MIAFDEYLGRINRGYKENISGNVHYLSVPALDELGFLKNGFTTRKGGISSISTPIRRALALCRERTWHLSIPFWYRVRISAALSGIMALIV